MSSFKEGLILYPGDGHDCLPCNKPVKVKRSNAGLYYVQCGEGNHFLYEEDLEDGSFSHTPWL